ncbi:hypothetical protein COLO4_05629 [Corchorus olitorius]|uniref:Uncharacterized protein n=1 Tax=Corchorus olitorius TaxID=93759 RepID=A0A1R3KQA0_9ROSI|nr:hypothetical protein COLO4_05629 [Corchorus olitorius]
MAGTTDQGGIGASGHSMNKGRKEERAVISSERK